MPSRPLSRVPATKWIRFGAWPPAGAPPAAACGRRPGPGLAAAQGPRRPARAARRDGRVDRNPQRAV